MKKFFLSIFTLFYLNSCFAQDTIERKNRLTDSVIERFHVLKTTPEIKNGGYKALFRRKTVIAYGDYKNDKRIGIWHFYTPDGVIAEKFNYDTGIFYYEGPLTQYTDIKFLFDEDFEKSDTVTRPLKVGGSYFGFLPYLNAFQMPFDILDVQTQSFTVIIELLVSQGGRLADYKVHITSKYYDYQQTFRLDVNLFNEADRKFIPAAVNGKPILSRIFIKCFINNSGGLDFY